MDVAFLSGKGFRCIDFMVIEKNAGLSQASLWGSRMGIIITALLLFIATLRGSRSSDQWELDLVVLTFPLQWLREASLFIIPLLLVALLFCHVKERTSGRIFGFASAPFLILVFNLIIMFRDYADGVYPLREFLLSVAGFCGLILLFSFYPLRPIAALVSSWALAVYWAFALFVVASLCEFLFGGVQNVYYSGRFYGVANHPVYCGVLSALGVIASIHLLMYSFFKGVWKLLCAALMGIGLGFIIGSGTRTGVVVLAAALVWMVRGYGAKGSFIYTVLAFFLGGGIAAYFVFRMISGDEFSAEARILSLENTREGSWLYLWQTFLESPWVGVPGAGAESSILMALARGGILFGSVFILGVGWFTWDLIRLYRLNRIFPPVRGLVGAGMALLALSVFEGYLNDRISFFNVSFFLVAATISSVLKIHSSPFRFR